MVEENKIHNLGLKILLGFLVIIIFVLLGAIITLGISNSNNEVLPQDVTQHSIKYDVAYYLDEAEKIYAGDAKNIDAVLMWFDKIISEDPTNVAHVYEMGIVEESFFSKYGLKEAELKGLIKIDFSILSDQAAHLFYVEIVKLATELKNDEIRQKYEKLVQDTQAAYDRSVEATKRRNEEAGIKSLKEEYE